MLRCNVCGATYDRSAGYVLDCCAEGLLIGDYPERFTVDDERSGLWRFHSWLPVDTPGDQPLGSVAVPHPELGAAIGLDDLWLSLNGCAPAFGAECPTCTFKDLEAGPTFQRLVECGAEGVVVATAGNTGRAFAHLGGLLDFPVLVIAAEKHVERLWRPGAPHAPTTSIVGVRGGDYGDAGDLAQAVAPRLGWAPEGGVKNAARRDGIGTLLLDAVVAMGELPDHYVQAVGGGPGPIGVADMAARLVRDGRFGDLPRFHLVQNVEHAPVHRAWTAGRSQLSADDFPPREVETYADVLVNRRPAYGLVGGLHDVLRRTHGTTRVVGGDEARAAAALFEETVGLDIMEPAAVALAGLADAVTTGDVARGDRVLLAVTGAGERLQAATGSRYAPDGVVLVDRDDTEAAVETVLRLVETV